MIKTAMVIHPFLRHDRSQASGSMRSEEAKLEEGCGLARAIGLNVVARHLVSLATVRPNTFLGVGKVEELGGYIAAQKIPLAIIDGAISPTQQRNLEKAWQCKVIDRTALILEIFGARAKTREGILQVELASLEYQKSRLVRSWTHLERQRGGFGFLGGPGEKQIEIDRRIVRDRIADIKKELEKVIKTRAIQRKARKTVPFPIVALVGYTNAGKSTLFNALTNASVYVEDLLFATLDPTLRQVKLPSGLTVILSDTVGFISNLPTELVAAFRATLEEVIEADLMIHVRDIAADDTLAAKEDVLKVLKSLGLEDKIQTAMLEVANKVDLLSPEEKQKLARQSILGISALTGEGLNVLRAAIDVYFDADLVPVDLLIPAANGKLLAWIHAHGQYVQMKPEEESIRVRAKFTKKYQAMLEKML